MGENSRRLALNHLRAHCLRRRLFRRSVLKSQPLCLQQFALGQIPQLTQQIPVKEIPFFCEAAFYEEALIVPVTFHIPGALREFTAGRRTVEIAQSFATLADALSALYALYPGVRDRVLTEQGQVREHINLFVGEENIRYTGGLATPLPPNSEISIVPAVSGG